MRRGGNLLVLGLLATAIALGVFLGLTSRGASGEQGSVLSESAGGRSLIFETLREVGITSRTWTHAPGALPDGGTLLWMHAVPETPPGYGPTGEEPQEGAGPDRDPGPVVEANARRRRDPLHYLRFMSGGGVLVVPAREGTMDFLVEELGLGPVAGLERVAFEGDGPLRVVLPDGESFETGWEPESVFAPPATYSPLEVVLANDLDQPLALRYEHGAGAVILLAPDDDFLDNARIVEPGNALLAVRLIEAHAPGREVLFDEYVLGGWTPDSPLSLAFAPANLPFSAHLVLWVAFILWSAAWVRAFPRDPVAWTPVSALMRAQGLAGLLVRARRFELLAALLRHGILRRLAPRASARGEPVPSTQAPEAALVRDRIAPLLAGAQGSLERGALELLVTRPVPDRAALERLGHDLSRLESVLSNPGASTGSRVASARDAAPPSPRESDE